MDFIETQSGLPAILGVSNNRWANAVKEGAELAGIIAGGGGGGAVDSVNGKTGTVLLRAIDLPEDNNATVQAALNHAAAERSSMQAGIASAHSRLDAHDTQLATLLSRTDEIEIDVETLQELVAQLERIISKGGELTTLDIAVYGDFHAIEWLNLENGMYYLEGSELQYSNAPFEFSYPSYSYGCEVSILNGEAYFLHKIAVLTVGEQTPPQVFWRAGQSALGDMMARGWSRLDSVGGSGGIVGVARYYIKHSASWSSPLPVNDGSFISLYEVMLAATTFNTTKSGSMTDGSPASVDYTAITSPTNGYKVKHVPSMGLQNISIQVRVSGHADGAATALKTLQIALHRAVDDPNDPPVAQINLTKDDASDMHYLAANILTYSDGAGDTFATDGFYLSLKNDSGRIISLSSVEILIQA